MHQIDITFPSAKIVALKYVRTYLKTIKQISLSLSLSLSICRKLNFQNGRHSLTFKSSYRKLGKEDKTLML